MLDAYPTWRQTNPSFPNLIYIYTSCIFIDAPQRHVFSWGQYLIICSIQLVVSSSRRPSRFPHSIAAWTWPPESQTVGSWRWQRSPPLMAILMVKLLIYHDNRIFAYLIFRQTHLLQTARHRPLIHCQVKQQSNDPSRNSDRWSAPGGVHHFYASRGESKGVGAPKAVELTHVKQCASNGNH